MKNKLIIFRLINLIVPLYLLFSSFNVTAQTPGLIFEGAPNTILDPNGDGYVSLPPSQTPSQFTNLGFPANINETDVFDILYSEITYVGLPEIVQEPTGDLSKGPSCAFTDLVQDAGSRSTYYNKSDDNLNMRFRFRLGGAASNSKGYSVLIDTDGLFGFDGPNKDPGATPGNPGFEVEIVLRTNFSVDAYDVDDKTTPSLIVSRPFTTHAIKSIALTTVCDDPDYFYDFYLPFSDLVGFITSTTELRMITLTSINPKGIIGNNGISDIAGVDDGDDTTDNLFIDAIEEQTPTDGPPLLRASCPEITGGDNPGSILEGDIQVQGTSTEEDGTIIQIYINDVAHGSTTTVTSGNWTQTGLSLSDGDLVKATATVPITVASGIEKGTSIDNCDIETVLLTACTPPATPTTIEIGNSGKSIDGTITGLNNQDVLIRIFSNGTELTTWGGAATDASTGYFTETVSGTGAWTVNGGGGFKANSGYYSVIIIPVLTDCPSEISNSIAYCITSGGGADGIESGTITLDTPTEILTTTTSISGVLGNTNATTVKLFKNDVFTGLTDTSSGDTAWSIDISSITIVSGDVLYVSNKEDAATCTSISANQTVIAKSQKPTLDAEFCSTGNITSVSGTTNETSGTITLYSKVSSGVTTSDTLEGTTSTITNGTWTITGLSIAPSSYIAATMQATGKTVSDISDEIILNSKTVPTTLIISSDPITEGDTSITGTSSGLPIGSTIQLYIDGSLIEGKTGTTDGLGDWTINDLDNVISGLNYDELYTNAVVTVSATSTAAGSCESDLSLSKVVVCLPPAIPIITAVSSSPICENSIFTVTIVDAQPGLAYQLLDQDNNTIGPTTIGPNTAANITIDSDPLEFGITSLKVKAFKILGTCTTVESNSLVVEINPSPTITFGANPFATYNASAQTVDLTFSGTTNSPDEYKIDFDDVAFTDVAYTTLPVSPIQINVPAGLTAGSYTATVTIREPTNGCEKSYPITITILELLAPTITFTNTNDDLCSGSTTASFAYSTTTNSPTLYSIDFNDTANLQGFTDLTDVTLPSSPITVTVPTSPDAGVYNAVIQLKTSGGLLSQEYPITFTIRKPDPGIIASDQVINSGSSPATFTSITDASETGGTITYQWQKSTTSATAGFSNAGGTDTGATYTDASTLTSTTYYKRIASSDISGNICTSESNVITVNVTNLGGTPMITQIYQVGTEKWIEVTNIHPTNSVAGGLINIQLYSDVFRSDQTGVTPTVNYTITTVLDAGKSVLLRSTSNVISNFDNSIPSNVIDNDAITIFNGGNDIISLSTTTDNTSWANRYDVVSSFADDTSLVRIDETLTPNINYTTSEWEVFVNDALLPYKLLAAGGAERHPHDPLISEIIDSNTDANTYLGLHRIDVTTRSGGVWNNGYPDRSRFVVIDEDYNHTTERLSARKLTVNASRKLGITDNLLIVTNELVLNGDIRLINSTGATGNSESQFIQTHQSASLVSGSGRLLVDQNSTVPSLYRYNYVGSPVISASGANDYTIAKILKDGTNPTDFDAVINDATSTGIAKDITFIGGTNYDGNFTNSPNDPITLADYWMYTYPASAGTIATWYQKRSTVSIPNSDGFIFKGPGRVQNYTFMGIPKDGNIITSIGQNESYLVANPYASALSVKKFIEDNINSITGTLYFWEHTGEEISSGEGGHNFAGYIGGYATRTIDVGVTAKAAISSIDINLEAEEAEIIGGVTETVLDNDGTTNINIVKLTTAIDTLTFKNISQGVDVLRLRYKANSAKPIRILENNVVKLDYIFNASATFTVAEIDICVLGNSNISFVSNNTDAIEIDYLNLKNDNSDGSTSCAPSVGNLDYTEPEPYIAIAQGFFVSGDSSGGGTITFNNSQREFITEGENNSVFLRTSSAKNNSMIDTQVIKLGMNFNENGEGNSYHRQIAVSFNPYNSFDFEKGYDAKIYDIGATDFYWKFPNNEDKYVIAGVEAIYNDLEVPLEISMGYTGDISIKVDEIKNVNGNVYITDKVTGISQEIINGKAALTLDQGTYTDRFVLAFKPISNLSINDGIVNVYTNMYVDNKNKNIIISKQQEIDINNVLLFDLLGKQVAYWKIKEQREKYQLKINRKLPTGVYIIKLNTDKGEINKKVIVE